MSEYKVLQERFRYLEGDLKNQMNIYSKFFKPYFRYKYDDYDWSLSKDNLKKLRAEDKIGYDKYNIAFEKTLNICGEKIKIKDALKQML